MLLIQLRLFDLLLCRNIALQSTETSHVLVSDVDLIPSMSFVDMVLSFLHRQPVDEKAAYVVPVFEVAHSGTLRRYT